MCIRRNDEWLPIGLTSFGALKKCPNGFPTGYTRLANFVPWIEAKTQIKTGCIHNEIEVDVDDDIGGIGGGIDDFQGKNKVEEEETYDEENYDENDEEYDEEDDEEYDEDEDEEEE